MAQLRTERERALSIANTAESLLKMEKVVQEKLAQQLKLAEAENLALKGDLGFFERLLPAAGTEPISVRGLQAHALGAGRLRYQLLVMQAGKAPPDFNGRYDMTLSGVLDGKPWTLAAAGGLESVAAQAVPARGRCPGPPRAGRGQIGPGSSDGWSRYGPRHSNRQAMTRLQAGNSLETPMFGKKKQPPIRTLVGEGAAVHGELRFAEGLRIDGEVHGDVVATGAESSILVISEKAQVVGKVKGGHVIINGSVTGPIYSDELLELQPKARIVGDVHYESLEMHQGAMVDGELRPLKAEEKSAVIKLATSSGG